MAQTIISEETVLAVLKRYGGSWSISLGQAVCDRAHRGLRGPRSTRELNGSLIVDPPADSPFVRNEDVRRLE